MFQSGAKGGKVLSLLHERTTSYIGDHRGQELCLYLTQKACVPYMEILEKWVYKGIICDPYEEVRFFSVTVFAIPLKIVVHAAGFHFLMDICILNKILLLFNNV
jgi:hypothetical protein